MSLLAAAAIIQSGTRIRGPFGVPELGGDGTFTPSGAAFDAAQAVFTELGASGYIYIFDTDSLRATEGGADGIAAGSIGYANDWRAPGTTSAAVAEGDRRPTLTTISSATYATFDGVDDELLWPFLGWSSGTLLIVPTMTDATDANQTALEIDALRIQSQFAGFTGPTVRVGGGVHVPFGLNSMLNRPTLLVVQFNRTANTLRLWHDGAAGWTESNVAAWDANPHESWERGNVSLLGRNSYVPTSGAPMTGGIHALVAIDTNAVTIDQVTDLAAPAIAGTAITISVPAYPGAGGGGGGEEELPTALNTINVDNQTALNNAIAGADPGDHIIVANGATVAIPNITRSGTSAAPIVIRAATNQGVTLSDLNDVTGNYVRLWGFNCGAQSFGNLTGTDFWVIRSKFIGGGGRRMQFKAPRAHFWYCEMTGQGQGVIFDTGDSVGGPGVMGIEGHVKGCYFHDYAMGAAFGNGNEPISVGRSILRTFVVSNTLIEDCLFEDCNIGGQEDETIAVKSSFVTVRNCTFVNARYLSNRHGKGNFYDRVMHLNSGAGGISINDGGGNQCRNCETRGGSRIRVMAGGVNSQDEGPPNWQTNDLGTQPVWPRSNGAVIDHANCVDTRAIIGFEFGSPYPGGLKPAINTVWRANRGLAPTLGTTAQQTGTTQPGSSPVAYVPPVVLTTNDVGVNA